MSKVFSLRLEESEIEEFKKIAISLNYFRGGKPQVSKVFREIAKGNLIVSQKIT